MAQQVLHILGSLERAGAESVALDLVKAIPSTEVRQTFFCLSGRRGALADQFERYGAEVITPSGSKFQRIMAYFRHVKHNKPDVVQSHVLLTSGWLLLGARLCGIRMRIARIHSEGDGQTSTALRRLYRESCRWALWLGASHVLAVSTASLEFSLPNRKPIGHGPDFSAVIPNGVDTGRFTTDLQQISKPPRYLHVGRNNLAKNRAALPPILRALLDEGPCSMRVIGSTDHSDIGPIPEGMLVEGPMEDIAPAYETASALVLPSLREGLPGVILEALSCGVPAVVSDLPSLRELSEKLNGITLISLAEDSEKWAQALMSAAAQSKEERRNIRQGVVESEFSLVTQSATWREIWMRQSPDDHVNRLRIRYWYRRSS